MSATPAYSAPPPDYNTAMNYGYDDKPSDAPLVGFQGGNYPPPYTAPVVMTPVAAVDPPPAVYSNTTTYNTAGTSNRDSYEFDLGNVASFSDKAVRRAFIRKVYLILMAQLLVTTAFVCIFMFAGDIKYWVQANSWFYYTSYGVFLVTLITLVCCPGFRRNYPWNFICLLIFTLAFSYMVGTISSFYTTDSVLVAAGITTAVCLAITCFAMQTKIDFTMCNGLIFALCMVFLFFGISVLIVYMTVPLTMFQARVLQCVYGGVAALLFSLFLVYDTQMILGGRKHEMDPEEYIYGALQLYLDVVYIFVIILALFGTSD